MLRLFFVSVCLMGLLVGCGSPAPKPIEVLPPSPSETPEGVVWAFSPNAIRVFIDATLDANAVGNDSHAVSLYLYQAADKEALVQKAKTRKGLQELLEGRSAPPETVSMTHLYIQPGHQSIFLLDRAEGAKFFAVVAGFDSLEPAACFAVTPIPVRQFRDRSFLLLSTTLYNAAPLDAKIFINNQKMQFEGAEGVF